MTARGTWARGVRQLERRPWIATVDQVLAPDECRELIAFAERVGFGDAPITTASGPQLNPGFRNNTRVMFDDLDRTAFLWERLADVVPPAFEGWRVLGLNERLRFYRYEPGQFFRWHMDGAYQRSHHQRSLLTLMVYLNEGFQGGTTDFDMMCRVEPEEGMALLFEHAVRHQGAPLRSGVKYVLRTDVMYGRPPG